MSQSTASGDASLIHGVHSTLGALFAGCLAAGGLSAVLGFQVFLYFQLFPADTKKYKVLVVWIWLNDATHTVLIATAVWGYVINNFGDGNITKEIMPALAVNVAFTAIITLTVNLERRELLVDWLNCGVVHRSHWNGIYYHDWNVQRALEGRQDLVFTRIYNLISKTFSNFSLHFNHLIEIGLAISIATDVVVSISRYYYLRNLRQGYPGTREMVDAVVVFTINDGVLTCAVVIGTIACILTMPNNFIWIAIYFTIAKFYSNSVLATLNLRNWYRHRQRPMGIPLSHQRPAPSGPVRTTMSMSMSQEKSPGNIAPMEVFVDQQVEYNVAVVDMPAEYGDSRSGKSVDIASGAAS